MKLYVIDPDSEEKIYLKKIANTRSDLAKLIGSAKFRLRKKEYHVNDVLAEPETNNSTPGIVVGGLFGLLGGPIGVAIGAMIGGVVANEPSEDDKLMVNMFNSKKVRK